MHERKIIFFILLSLLLVAWCAVHLASVVRASAAAREAQRIEEVGRVGAKLLRSCAAMWPLRGANYDECAECVKLRYRRDM